MEVYKVKTDPETLKKIEELTRKIGHEIWLRQQKRNKQQLEIWRRLRRKEFL